MKKSQRATTNFKLETVIRTKNNTGKQKINNSFQVKTGPIFRELQEAREDTELFDLFTRAQKLSLKLKAKQRNIELAELTQQTDSELEEEDIVVYPSNPKLKLPKDGKEPTHNAYIKLRLPSHKMQVPEKANRVVTRAQRIGEYLDYLHQFPQIMPDAQIQVKISNEAHQNLLEWFYNLLFKDTQDHPPLLGWAQLEFPLKHGNHKKFNPAQIILYKALTQAGWLTISQVAYVAIKLRNIWLEFN
ncbi:hypothetical protein PTTG_28137 [Puccinia triticina 1-1 BBBD Race 1]|uniref:Uncharacterized protein n=2 Tax=Puccinia triticina TaxID=208348 RepID=A0A180GE83_PUCT1|nr:hypothetical protein PTTG_28137 [Puccinia triticina 1-1 BBBD Race 1]